MLPLDRATVCFPPWHKLGEHGPHPHRRLSSHPPLFPLAGPPLPAPFPPSCPIHWLKTAQQQHTRARASPSPTCRPVGGRRQFAIPGPPPAGLDRARSGRGHVRRRRRPRPATDGAATTTAWEGCVRGARRWPRPTPRPTPTGAAVVAHPPKRAAAAAPVATAPPTADRGFRHTPASRTHPTNRHRVPPPRAPPVPLPPRCLHACTTRAARGGGGGGGGGRWRLVRGGHTARWWWGSLIFDADRGACAGGPSCVVYDPPAADVGGDCTRPLPPAGVCLHTPALGRAWSLQTPPTTAAVAVGACVGGALGARRGPLCAAVEGSARPALPPAGAVLVIARGCGLRGVEAARCGATGDVRCLLSLSRRPLL